MADMVRVRLTAGRDGYCRTGVGLLAPGEVWLGELPEATVAKLAARPRLVTVEVLKPERKAALAV